MDLSDREIIGVIRELFHDGKTARFDWRIRRYVDLHMGIYTSPAVKYFNRVFHLAIHLKSMNIEDDEVYLHGEMTTPGIGESVRFNIGYEKKGGSEVDIVRDEAFPAASDKWGPGRPRWLELPLEQLSITCKVWKDESTQSESVSREAQAEDASCTNGRNDEHRLRGISLLSEHFGTLLLSGDHHDLLLRVKDKEFRAHKCVLSRSPVFAAMFRSDMTETADDSVSIDDCDPEAFGQFLQYVYAGNVDISSTGHALGLYYAADKYDFPNLKEICVEFLKSSLAAATLSDVITLAARHDEEELLQLGIVYFSKHLEEVLATVEWQRFVSANPIQGNEMCLKAVKCLNKR